MNAELRRILEPAYYPCKGFSRACNGLVMPWNSAAGHVPRGFYGALGDLSEVRLVMVLAQPNNPGSDEDHTSGIDSAFAYAGQRYRHGDDPGHANTRSIIQKCFCGSWQEAMRKVWITNSVLCSVKPPRAKAKKWTKVEQCCGEWYLLRQLLLFPHAVIAAMGTEVHSRVNRLKKYVPHASNIGEYVSPYYRPGWNSPLAKASWDKLVTEVAKVSP